MYSFIFAFHTLAKGPDLPPRAARARHLGSLEMKVTHGARSVRHGSARLGCAGVGWAGLGAAGFPRLHGPHRRPAGPGPGLRAACRRERSRSFRGHQTHRPGESRPAGLKPSAALPSQGAPGPGGTLVLLLPFPSPQTNGVSRGEARAQRGAPGWGLRRPLGAPEGPRFWSSGAAAEGSRGAGPGQRGGAR